jgi:hypothetical protein
MPQEGDDDGMGANDLAMGSLICPGSATLDEHELVP